MTQTDIRRLTAIAYRNGAGDDAPDIAHNAIAWYLALPQPLTRVQAERPFDVLARRTQTQALNFRKRHARQVALSGDIRVTYSPARFRESGVTAVLAKLSAEDRALLLAERGTVTASQRVRRARLVSKIRAMIK